MMTYDNLDVAVIEALGVDVEGAASSGKGQAKPAEQQRKQVSPR